jgi:hypothetical protein
MRPVALLISAALACLAIGCGEHHQKGNDSGHATTAKDAVDGFIDALLDADGPRACAYLSPPGKAHVGVIVTNDERQAVNFDCAGRFDEYISALGKDNLRRLEDMDFRRITGWDPPPEAAPEVKRAARSLLPFSPDGNGLKDPVLTVEHIGDRWKLQNVPDPQEDFPSQGGGGGG